MASDKFTRSRANLVLAHPFFGALALRLKAIADPSIETACTDGQTLRYNPEFIDKLPVSQVAGVIAHEVMHNGMLHHTRRGSRDAKKWNIACDYAINWILKDAGLDLPDETLINPAWKDKCAEEIYTLLPPQMSGGNGDKDDPGGNGGVQDGRGQGGQPPTQSEINEQEAEWKVALAQAATVAKQQGRLPAHLERMILATLEPKTNWRAELQQFCNTPIPADVTWSRPNRRFVYQGLYLPSADVKKTGRFVTVIDTSGSIGEQELNEFGSEIKGIVDQLQPEETIVIYCDAAVNGVDRFGPHDELTFRAIGGGGTDFRPPFKWLEDNNIRPDALVYLTDGYGSFPDENDVEFPTLWAINNRQVVPPFGVHVVIEV